MRSSVGHVGRIAARIFPGHVMPPFARILSAASPSMQTPLLPGTRKFASMLKFGDGMLNLRTTHITMRGMSSVPSPSGSGAVGSAGRIFDVTGANFPQVVESRYRNKRRKSAREIKSERKNERERDRERERDSFHRFCSCLLLYLLFQTAPHPLSSYATCQRREVSRITLGSNSRPR